MAPLSDLALPCFEIPKGLDDLTAVVPSRETACHLLESFAQTIQPCYFPYVPASCAVPTALSLLSNLQRGSTVAFDELAALFAALAIGHAHSICSGNENQRRTASLGYDFDKINAYGMLAV